MQSMYDEEDQYLPLRETVYKRLRKRILTGELKPGERLMEIHLANEMDVSRTPIREAIRKLELEGLVRIIPRSGAQVASISEKELRDVLELRRGLEAFSSKLACTRITDEQKEALRKAERNFARVAGSETPAEIAAADVDFHEIIFQATGNKRLIDIMHQLADQVYRYRYEYIKDDTNYGTLVEEHHALTEAILNGDEEEAARISGIHIDRQEQGILAQLRK